MREGIHTLEDKIATFMKKVCVFLKLLVLCELHACLLVHVHVRAPPPPLTAHVSSPELARCWSHVGWVTHVNDSACGYACGCACASLVCSPTNQLRIKDAQVR